MKKIEDLKDFINSEISIVNEIGPTLELVHNMMDGIDKKAKELGFDMDRFSCDGELIDEDENGNDFLTKDGYIEVYYTADTSLPVYDPDIAIEFNWNI